MESPYCRNFNRAVLKCMSHTLRIAVLCLQKAEWRLRVERIEKGEILIVYGVVHLNHPPTVCDCCAADADTLLGFCVTGREYVTSRPQLRQRLEACAHWIADHRTAVVAGCVIAGAALGITAYTALCAR